MRKHLLGAVLLAGVALVGCAANPMTGRSQLMLVNEQSAINSSTMAYQNMIGEIEKNGKLSEDQALVRRVEEVTDRLITQAVRYRPDSEKWAWTVKVIDDPKTLNAFCMAGGKMAIYTGIIEQLEMNDDELAQVMGHEIAHALASHTAEKMSVQVLSNVAVVAISAAAGRGNSQRQHNIRGVAELAALTMVNLPNSRQAEEEADKLGIELAARAGYRPDAAAKLWQKMAKLSGGEGRSDFFSTHPASLTRSENLAALAEPMQKLYDPAQLQQPLAYSWLAKSAKPVAAATPVAQLAATADAAPTESGLGKGSAKRVGGKRAAGKAEANVGDSRQEERPVTALPTTALATEPSTTDRPKEALRFYSAEFDQFSEGKAELNCPTCSPMFVLKQTTLQGYFAGEQWRDLATETMKIGYGIDLAWFYLGQAAQKLGFPRAARIYAEKAQQQTVEGGNSCAKGFLIRCQGIDVAQEAGKLLE